MTAPLPRISTPRLALFSLYVERYLRRNFHSVRLDRTSAFLPPGTGGAAWPAAPGTSEPAPSEPLVLFANHPSWWDPLIALLLARRLFPRRRHYAPMDAAALERYRFFAKLGYFGVEQGTTAGARRFLETATSIVATPGSALWITPQGGFADPRERPIRIASGLANLVRRLGRVALVPVALEYPFWSERRPEALVRVGRPLAAEDLHRAPVAEIRRALECALEHTADALARPARARDDGAFVSLLAGSAGVGGVYDLWRRLRSAARGETFDPSHDAIVRARSGRPRAARGRS